MNPKFLYQNIFGYFHIIIQTNTSLFTTVVLTVTECIVDVDGGPKKGGSNCKKNAGKKASKFSTRNPRTFWGGQSKQVPGTDLCPVYFWFYYLIGPSLVMRKEMRKATMVVRTRVHGKAPR